MKICVPIKADNMKDFLVKFAQAQNNEKVDLVEIWLDQIEDLNIEEIFKFKSKPLIGVVKDPKEFGKFVGSRSKKIAILTKFVEFGGDFVDASLSEDFEYFNGLKKEYKFQIIGSFHDFIRTPSLQELEEIIKHRIYFDCDIIKIATMIQQDSDLNIIQDCVDIISKFGKKPIVIGMGNLGKVTRLGEGVFKNNFLTFVALNEEERTAEGQVCLNEL